MDRLNVLFWSAFLVMAGAAAACGKTSRDPGDSDHPTDTDTPDNGFGGGESASGARPGSEAGTTGSGVAGNRSENAGTGGGIGMAGGGSGGATLECVTQSFVANDVPPTFLFLVDVSKAMALPVQASDPPNAPGKILETRDALLSVFGAMPEGTGAGLIYYPNTPGSPTPEDLSCIRREIAVPIAPTEANQQAKLQVAASRPSCCEGSTPLEDAYAFAVQTLEASALVGRKYLVLVTGSTPTYAANCSGDGVSPVPMQALIELVRDARGRSIETVVFGIPGSESARSGLSEMATVGGSAKSRCSDAGPNFCHFDLTQASDLGLAMGDALVEVMATKSGCSFQFAEPGFDPSGDTVEIVWGSGLRQLWPQSANCSDEVSAHSGWQYSADRREIVLCSGGCRNLKSDPRAHLEITRGCANGVP